MNYGGRACGHNGVAPAGPRPDNSPQQRLSESRHSSDAAVAPPDLGHHEQRVAMATQQAAQCPLAVSLPINIRCVEQINTRFDRDFQCGLNLAHRHGIAD